MINKWPAIRRKFLDRWNKTEDWELQTATMTPTGGKATFWKLTSIRGWKAKEIENILKKSELQKYIDSKSVLLIYGNQISGTPLDKEMKSRDFVILYEEKEIDDEIEFDVHPRVTKVVRIQHYLFRDEVWDIMYFRNPFYEWDVLDCMEYEYGVVNHRWKYIEKWTELIERPEYNEKFLKKLQEEKYTLMDINFLPEEFDDQLTGMVKLISSIYGQTIIKWAETEMLF
ncbi:MAG: hypothetical protein ACD_2C00263G0007 [uncultured bacterium (gcode 4)]|uniref:Uncharacterized protein n=1 Tax=uncultured bacterium (gcode 4) TaxID=1234023 RepID=K2FCV5_9BACT|nr:MAG: hypothetical protein ACD_2C00263G0007 [uncultured bacterium (gcode 4)]